MDVKKSSLLVLLLLAVLPSHALMHDGLRSVLAGSLLVAALFTGNKCYQSYLGATSEPSFNQKVKNIYNQMLEKNDTYSLQQMQTVAKRFVERYGSTIGWGILTVVLGSAGIKILYKCLKG